ncbi:MAG: hypothetical protein ABI972_27270, partial [Acidobacteriota bacterium]
MTSPASFRRTPFDYRVCAALVLLICITRFWHAPHFGLYEDDYFHVALGFNMKLRDAITTAWSFLVGFPHGRPIGWAFEFAISYLDYRAGGILAIYGAAAAIVSANAITFYFLMKRISCDAQFAVVASVAFCLYPADTTQAFLTHM